jgi:hypothetical protein
VGLDGLYQLASVIYDSTPIDDILNPLHRQIEIPKREKLENPFKIKNKK